MKKTKQNTNELLLKNISLFTDEDMKIFESYFIDSLEKLLGATKGLTNIKIFENMKYGRFYIERIKEIAGEEELKKYSQYDQSFPTGLIIDKNGKL